MSARCIDREKSKIDEKGLVWIEQSRAKNNDLTL